MKHIIYIILVLLPAVLILSCRDREMPASGGNHAVNVKLVEVVDEDFSKRIEVYGILSSDETANMSFKLPGIIRKVYVREGDAVKKGTLLAELITTEADAQLMQSRESYEKQLRDHQRVDALYRDSVATYEQLQNSQTALSIGGEAVRVAEFNQQSAKLYAPSDGVVLDKTAGEGAYVNPGQPIFTLSLHTDKALVIHTGIAATDWQTISSGDPVIIHIEAFPGQNFEGVIRSVAQAADLSSGLYNAEIMLLPCREKLSVGMFAQGTIHAQKNVRYKSVPASCIYDGSGQQAFVYIPDGSQAKKLSVTVAAIREGKAYISAGLENISRIINEGSGFLSPNSTIHIQ